MTIIALDFTRRRIATLEGVPGAGTGPVLTSLAYPLEVTESLDVAPILNQGWLEDPIGAIDVTGGIVSGTLTVTIAYQTITADPEALDVTGGVVSGTLEVVIGYQSIEADPESLDVTGGIVSGTLEVVINYVTLTMDPEGLDVSAAIVSGTLT